MAVTLTGSNGLFTRLGKLFLVGENLRDVIHNTSTGIPGEIEDVIDEFSDADMKYIRNVLDEYEIQSAMSDVFNVLAATAVDIVVGMVGDDTAITSYGGGPLTDAMLELISQMDDTSDSIDGTTGAGPLTIGSGITALGSNTGDGIVISGYLTRTEPPLWQADWLQTPNGETAQLLCTQDAQIGTTQAGQELFVYTGEVPARLTITDPHWPGAFRRATQTARGSSGFISHPFTVIDPSEDAQEIEGRNRLRNSDFEVFTVSDVPDGWTYVTGSATTDFAEENSVVHRNTSSIKLIGDGSTAHDMYQQFNAAGGTTARLTPNTITLLAMAVRESATFTGTVKAALVDGSNTVLGSGFDNYYNGDSEITLTTSSGTSWTYAWTLFKTPADIPATTRLRIWASSAIGNTHEFYIDSAMLVHVNHLAIDPVNLILPGETDFVVGDRFILSGSYNTPTDAKFAYWCQRMLNVGPYLNEVVVPYDTGGSETIADTLIS